MLQFILRLTPDFLRRRPETGGVMAMRHLGQVPLRQVVELVSIDLPAEDMEPLMERGILPGCRLCPVRLSPSGDPILSVDGSLIALRRETAACLCVRALAETN